MPRLSTKNTISSPKHPNLLIYLFKRILIEFNYKVRNLYLYIKKIRYKNQIKSNTRTHLLLVCWLVVSRLSHVEDPFKQTSQLFQS